jgi:DNA primase
VSKIETSDFDIIAYLQSRNIRYWTSGKNVSRGWVGINCLFCVDRSNHLGINLSSKAFSCHSCGEKGNVFKLIQEIEGVNFPEAVKILNEFSGGEYVRKEKHFQSKVVFPEGTTKNFAPTHIDFLIKRGYNPEEVIEKYDLYATGPIGAYKHRIIIPIYMNQRLVSFVGRDVTEKQEIPYKNSSENTSIKDPKHCLYNVDSVLQNKAIIVEGILDAWRIGDGAVATFGKQYTHEQIRLLKGLKKVFVLYDADAGSLAEKLAYDVSCVVSDVVVLTLDEGDPDNMTLDDVRHLRKIVGF